MKKTIILIVCGILINNISYAKYSQNDKENSTILGQNIPNPIVNFNEPLQVPKDRPIKTRRTKEVVLGDATQQPFSAEVLLAGGFSGKLGAVNNEGASPYLTRYLPKEKPTYTTREVYKAAFEKKS